MSPIEERLWAALATPDMVEVANFRLMSRCDASEVIARTGAIEGGRKVSGVIAHQVRFDSYVIDIVVTSRMRGLPLLIAVECDGHDFHERTKEQAARDKSRDRALVKAGFRVIRFTGSEIWHRPSECADEIVDIIEGEWHRRENAHAS